MDTLRVEYIIVLGVLAFLFATIAVVILSRRDKKYLGGNYIKLLIFFCTFSSIVPVFYAGGPLGLTLGEAYSLRGWYAGSANVFISYLFTLGMVVGGGIALCFKMDDSEQAENK